MVRNLDFILLALLPALLNAGILLYVLFYLPKSRLTDIFSCVVFAVILWQLEDTILRSANSLYTARFADKLFCIGWLFVAPLAFHFACKLSRFEELTSRFALFLLYAPFIIFYLLYLSNSNTTVFSHDNRWGWINMPRQGTYDELQRYWMALTIIATVFILVWYAFNAGTNKNKKFQARIIAFGIMIPALQGILTQVIFPLVLHIKEIPVTSSFMTVFSLATIVGITRYKLLEVAISEHMQADILMSNLVKIIVIISPEKKIIYANEYARTVLGIKEEEIEGVSYEKLFFPGENNYHSFSQHVFYKVIDGTSVHNFPSSFQDSENKRMYVLITTTPIMSNNLLQGVMLVANDITEMVLTVKQLEEERVIKEKAITYAVLCAQEKERKVLGTELHDNINQILTGSLLYLKMAKKGTAKQPSYLEEIEVLIQQAMYEIRKLSHTLITPSLDEIDLNEALDNLITIVNRTETLCVKKTFRNVDENNMPEQLKLNIYRIIQEQISNIIKHANAKTIWIKLTQKDGKLQVCIKDDGVGFDTAEKSQGVGLSNIKTRASVYNGKLKIISAPGKGCQVTVTFEGMVTRITESMKPALAS